VRAGTADRLIVRTISGGILDSIKLYVDKPPTMRLSVRPFSATDADIVNGEKNDVTKTMQADGPRILAERLVAKLKELGPYGDVCARPRCRPRPTPLSSMQVYRD
jgi:hypothetical protein